MSTTEDSFSGSPEWRISSFFAYWRRRQAFIESLDLKENCHEANVLLWAAIDALSNHWAKNLGNSNVAKTTKRLVFDAFLAKYGGSHFQLVSLPDVWHRASCHPGDLPVECRSLCQSIDRRTPESTDRRTRQSSDDYVLNSLLQFILDSCDLKD
ncbi:hypothetical protein, partial [Synechococcus sp. CCAP 1479/13]|uniref:hypothetical protein n=1 Tax=Synechococcus sp. CCAP 1479/13 TaxID=1221595 RepID=UPI001C221EDD